MLSWFENLTEEEQPPRHIWWSEKLLDKWIKDVIEKRKPQSSGDEANEMVGNELVDRAALIPK